MKKYASVLTAFCITLLTVPAFTVHAVMIGLSTAYLVRESDSVVLGRIESAEATWNEDRSLIVTRSCVHIESVIRGYRVPSLIEVEYIGGEIDGLGLQVSDRVITESCV